ncbi:MAG: hypothetical protein DME69_13510 [Verrucomicrobia bacterium]|nr:MAG: hypothetical protein DME69_13510 [Verrucomicrobiota bacterium]
MMGCSKLQAKITAALLLVICAGVALAQTQSPSLAPAELVRKTVQNEVKAATDDSVRYMFRSRKETPRGTQTKLYVQTRDAMVGLLIALNDKPLTPEQRQAEESRVERLLKNPAELQHKRKQEKDDEERTTRIMKALPDAFLYQYDGTETGKQGVGAPGDELVRLRFRSNPNYNPPSRVEQVLAGMQGVLLIDAKRNRVAKIEGTLFRDIGFGWGILGHLDKGGHFLVEQTSVPGNGWEISHMNLNFTGKIMMFKRLTIRSDEIYSDFRPVPRNLTFAQGFALLKKQEALLAENHVSGNTR